MLLGSECVENGGGGGTRGAGLRGVEFEDCEGGGGVAGGWR